MLKLLIYYWASENVFQNEDFRVELDQQIAQVNELTRKQAKFDQKLAEEKAISER